MKSSLLRLVDFWRECPVDQRPYIHPHDQKFVPPSSVTLYNSTREYVNDEAFGKEADVSLHVGLLPLPYFGHLETAKVFILMLNPGLSPADYHAEYDVPDYRMALVANLHQNNGDMEFPALFLNPEFGWHPGFNYWHSKFSNVIRTLSNKRQIAYREGLRPFATHIASLELVAYHSPSFGAGKLLDKLPSVQLIKSYASESLLPRAEAGEITLVVARRANIWDLPQRRNIIIYEGTEARSAHLTLNSRGGKAIAAQLGI